MPPSENALATRVLSTTPRAPSHLSSLPSYCIRYGAAVPVGPSEVQSPTGERTPGDGQTFVNHLERPSGTHHVGTTGICHQIPPADHFPRRSASSPVAPTTLHSQIWCRLGIYKRQMQHRTLWYYDWLRHLPRIIKSKTKRAQGYELQHIGTTKRWVSRKEGEGS